ncbi:MAG: rRNA (cytidine1402-2-O)-methyltransferase [Patescibacteria group bacterium]|nr:rRNA (cytidine1402-2-O)-methyltransferase [Patescibacteria group bacterium]
MSKNIQDNMSEEKGKLILVSTPIGNLEDITYRAIRVLKEADYIVCEDTRTTNNLLKHYNITNSDGSNKSLLIFHANSSPKEISRIISFLEEGKTLAYVSDAGTPTISDPGVLLVNKIREINSALEHGEQIIIDIAPGVSAAVSAYSLSGASGNSFVFKGFMPHKKGRETMIKDILESEITSIVYESVHRIEKMLSQFVALEKELNIKKEYVICRELTKIYQEVITGSSEYCLDYFSKNQDKIRGEFVVVIK